MMQSTFCRTRQSRRNRLLLRMISEQSQSNAESGTLARHEIRPVKVAPLPALQPVTPGSTQPSLN
jgi:hypothetical protein